MRLPNLLLRYTILLGVFLTGCVDDEIESLSDPNGNCMVSVQYDVAAPEVISRSTSEASDERKVNNIYVMIFNASNTLEKGVFYYSKDNVLYNEDETVVEGGKIILSVTASKAKRICAIANVNRGNETLGVYDVSLNTLKEIRSYENLKKLQVKLSQEVESRGSSFLMTADNEHNLGINGTNKIKLSLKRLDAKIQFKIKAEDSGAYTNVTFTPREWRVLKMAKNSAPFANNFNDGDDANYFDTKLCNFESNGVDNGVTYNGFSFYTLENTFERKSEIPTHEGSRSLSAEERYAYREKQEKINEPEDPKYPGVIYKNGDYIYAHKNSTYVEITGVISYKENNKQIMADVKYTIHLGYATKNGVANPEDFNTLRNTDYIYNVTVYSANSIKVEVERKDEKQPGHEGSYTESDEIKYYDAHYETDFFVLNNSQLGNNLKWSVKTPFSDGVSDESKLPKDYKWIYFRLGNKTNNIYDRDKKFKSYTDEVYEAGVTLEQVVRDVENKVDKLMDVNTFVNLVNKSRDNLENESILDVNGDIAATVFVDEYYYDKNPEDDSMSDDLWKQFVNKPERILNIMSDSKYSEDGASKVAISFISFRQKSIQTMFNTEEASLKNAWGIEWQLEGNRLPIGPVGSKYCKELTFDANNGLDNTKKALEDINNWNTIVNSESNSLKTNYANIVYACMNKNRDLNSNGKIDNDEIRWYLAAINQLTDMWIGEFAIDPEARLYIEKNAPLKTWTWPEDFYASSTFVVVNKDFHWGTIHHDYKRDDNTQILWSSEGSSISDLKKDFVTDRFGGASRLLNYRCVRNLGNIGTTVELIEVEGKIAKMNKLSRKAIRERQEPNVLADHHERDPENRPYWAFELGEINNKFNTFEQILSVKSCATGYRAPNQRELAIMFSRFKTRDLFDRNKNIILGCSRFSLGGPERQGFAIEKHLFLLNESYNKGYVRCIKDLPKR